MLLVVLELAGYSSWYRRARAEAALFYGFSALHRQWKSSVGVGRVGTTAVALVLALGLAGLLVLAGANYRAAAQLADAPGEYEQMALSQ